MDENKYGRPTKYKKEYDEIAERMVSQGHSVTAVAGELNVNRDTVYEWKKVHRSFSDAIKRGTSKGQAFYEKLILGLAQGNESDRLTKVDKTALIFVLKTRFHKEWGNRDKVEVDAKVTNTISYEDVDTNKLEAIEAILNGEKPVGSKKRKTRARKKKTN